MCNCIQEIEQATANKIVSKFYENGKEISITEDIDNGLQSKALMFSSGTFEICFPMEYKYIIKGKEKPIKYKTNLFPNFCPFCGIKIER